MNPSRSPAPVQIELQATPMIFQTFYSPKRNKSQQQGGFSLIELMTVLAIVGLITALVSIRWSSIYRKAIAESEVARIEHFDGKTRLHLLDRRLPGKIIYDFQTNSVSGTRWSEGRAKTISFKLSDAVRMVDSKGLTVEGNKRSVDVLGDASTPNYAIKLDLVDKQFWILFAGQTGQAIRFEKESELDSFF